jgi:thiol-disulfide isomerase/thioredoxin
MRNALSSIITMLLASLLTLLSWASAAEPSGRPWYGIGEDGGIELDLWFFWSEHCPHCQQARPQVEALPSTLPWLRLHSLQLDGDPENLARYRSLAGALGQEARSVPAILFCGRMMVGWSDGEHSVRQLRKALNHCHNALKAGRPAIPKHGPQSQPPVSKPTQLSLPIFGDIDSQAWSLPLFTLVLAGLDSFNPCAFFVLLFLLSLLIHAGSRRRMLVVGGLFIMVSGLVYFLSMAAWLNLFYLIGHLTGVTLLAGLLALTIGVFNVKDFFLFQRRASLAIPERAKPKLFARIRTVIGAQSLPAMLTAAMMLAVVANLYELLCTAGFPMVYTRTLTLSQLPASAHYLYLALYNLIYIVPLLLIMLVFVFTLGSRKLQAREGQILKLLSGLMMSGLGAMLVFAPGLLDRLWTAALLLLGAVAITWIVARCFPTPS